ncbi:MAG: amino acid--tRNA ligase-related protein [Candidatus Moraniibacteriota bacterium]
MKTYRRNDCSIAESRECVGKNITLSGWVHSLRLHGKVAFCDLRDFSGKIQVVFTGRVFEQIKKVSLESVIQVSGIIVERQQNCINANQPLGDREIVAETLHVFSSSTDIPFPVDDDTSKIDESLRMKYRYLDLRSDRMRRNIRSRHEAMLFLRNYYSENGFCEVETPMLTKGTPEGAREFIVPSRIHPGQFYVLPQSPQQFKQLLMVSGMGKYFQVARCFRDEDQRQDRQPEFTQFDIEMSFADEGDVMQVVEDSVKALVLKVFPDKKILTTPFPRMTYAESIKNYGCDKPDMRKGENDDTLAFCWVTEFPLFEEDSSSKSGISSAHHPFTMPLDEDIPRMKTHPLSVRSTAFDLVLNGYEISSGSARIYDANLQKNVFELLGLEEEEIQNKFGHMLRAFSLGVPPHAGTGLGIDRLFSTILGEGSIREVIAFPKTGEAKDLLMGAPSELSDETLRQAWIEKRKK